MSNRLLSSARVTPKMMAAASRRVIVASVRHGQSEANVAGLVSSDLEIGSRIHGLTELGRQQAAETATNLCRQLKQDLLPAGVRPRFLVVHSPYRRTRETAAVLVECLRKEFNGSNDDDVDCVTSLSEPRLVERHFGVFDQRAPSHDLYRAVWRRDRLQHLRWLRRSTPKAWGPQESAELEALLQEIRDEPNLHPEEAKQDSPAENWSSLELVQENIEMEKDAFEPLPWFTKLRVEPADWVLRRAGAVVDELVQRYSTEKMAADVDFSAAAEPLPLPEQGQQDEQNEQTHVTVVLLVAHGDTLQILNTRYANEPGMSCFAHRALEPIPTAGLSWLQL